MHRRYFDITFFFSLGCSLVINTGMVSVVVYHTQAPAVVSLDRWRRSTSLSKSHPTTAPTAPAVTQQFPLPQDNPVLPPPPKPVVLDNRETFGETGGVGSALNSSPGEQLMQAAKGPQEQAFLGRTPPRGGGAGGGGGGGGQGGAGGAAAAIVPAAPGAGQMIGANGPTAAATPNVKVPPLNIKPAPQPQPAKAIAQTPQIKPPSQQTSKFDGKGTGTVEPVKPELFGVKTPPPPAAPAPSAAPPPPPPAGVAANATPTNAAATPVAAQASPAVNQSPSQPGQPGRPGSPGAPGAPGASSPTAATAPPSDKESDPFSDSNSFKFVNGRVVARNGRWVKTVKPELTDAGWIDASLMADPAVTFLATVDEQGNVVHVMTYRSSGSDNIDLPCEEALNQWKIEPSKDASGHPVRDVVAVTFGLER
ncbi:MAG TPA: hypothetical protein VL992_03950 [Tepidisphaeraceae bacterium]|nr:hypothetical protein [Tepidisphaeraceae bacterium]